MWHIELQISATQQILLLFNIDFQLNADKVALPFCIFYFKITWCYSNIGFSKKMFSFFQFSFSFIFIFSLSFILVLVWILV